MEWEFQFSWPQARWIPWPPCTAITTSLLQITGLGNLTLVIRFCKILIFVDLDKTRGCVSTCANFAGLLGSRMGPEDFVSVQPSPASSSPCGAQDHLCARLWPQELRAESHLELWTERFRPERLRPEGRSGLRCFEPLCESFNTERGAAGHEGWLHLARQVGRLLK